MRSHPDASAIVGNGPELGRLTRGRNHHVETIARGQDHALRAALRVQPRVDRAHAGVEAAEAQVEIATGAGIDHQESLPRARR